MKQLSLLCLLVFVISGCSKKSSDINQQSDLDQSSGRVILYNEYDNLIKDWSGVNVTIENSNPLIRVVTNEKGDFLLPELGASQKLVVVYSKTGFNTYKQYLNPSLIDSVNTGKANLHFDMKGASNVLVNSLTSSIKEDSVNVSVNVSFPQTTGSKYIRFLMSTDSDLGVDNITTITKNVSKTFKVNNGDNTITVCRSCMQSCGFKSGDTVYMKAFGATDMLYYYTDEATSKIVMASLNPESKSGVISFIVP
jgi:hypothetical protein